MGVLTIGRAVSPRHAIPGRTLQVPERAYRPEIQGVRGIALTLVVLFHVLGDGRISGGIDVFLTITGFLFTQSLLRRAVDGEGRIDLRAHFSHIVQRLLPPVLVVLAGISVATLIWFPSTRWLQTFREVRASALYFENWELINSQLDYNAAGPQSSPLQHFWSLSIQGQFHLLWPLVIIVAVLIARRAGISPVVATLAMLAGMTVVSFGYSVWLTSANQPVAYYHTGTRIWEFALGGLAALLLPQLRLSSTSRTVLGWSGLAMIVTCGFIFGAGADFPGVVSLWPVSGLLLILAAGSSQTRLSVNRFLVARPLRFVADISYALYLWHWPVLVFFLAALERQQGPWDALVILSTSFLLAWATTALLDGTVHAWLSQAKQRHRVRAVTAMVVGAAMVTTVSVAWLTIRQERAVADSVVRANEQPGAAALVLDDYEVTPGELVDADEVVPTLGALPLDLPEIYERGCIQDLSDSEAHDEVLICDDDVSAPTARVVMTGGSHVQQWWPAMSMIADRNGWELIVVDKDACHFTADRDGSLGSPQNDSCYRWNDMALDVIEDLDPDAVFTLGSTTRGMEERLPEGLIEAWRLLDHSDIPVIAMRDTIRLSEPVPECLETQGYNPVECGGERSQVLMDSYPPAVNLPENAVLTDMTGYLCDEQNCPAIVGNVVVYRDSSHVTATYMRTLAPFLEETLRDDAPWLFTGRAAGGD